MKKELRSCLYTSIVNPIKYDRVLSNYLQSGKTFGVLLSVFIFLHCGLFVNAQTKYSVSPTGTETSSLAGAKENIRSHTSAMGGNITVELADGTYFLTEPLVFDENDGGNGKYEVVYKAASGANPVISGGKLITGWEQDPDHENLYCVKVDETSIPYIRNLYINDKRAKRARSNIQYRATRVYEENGKKAGLVFPKNSIPQLANTGIEINYTQHWRDFYYVVDEIIDGTAVDGVGNDKWVIKIKNFNWNDGIYLAPGESGGVLNKFYFENAIVELDEPGEWCYDYVSKYLYYYPATDVDMNTVEAIIPTLEKLIDIKSTGLDKKVENLVFHGITFAHNSWDWPSVNGLFPYQSSALKNEEGTFKLPAAIQLDGAENVTFESNKFKHTGNTALDVYNNASNIYITNNSFVDVAASGISVARTAHNVVEPVKGEGLVENVKIKNNSIERAGAEFGSCPGIELIYARNVEISHNDIYNVSYSGMSIGWGWTPTTTTSTDITVRNNRIIGINQKADDGGSIYSLSGHGGNGLIIEENYIDELSLPSPVVNEGAIYTDEGSSNVHIKNNVVKSSRKWFFHNYCGRVNVDSMYVSSSTANWGGNNGASTDITLEQEHVWQIPHNKATEIEENAGIKNEMVPENNVALNKPAVASSYLNTETDATKANDGLTTTIWHSGTGDQPSWSVDLQDDFIISAVQLVFGEEGEDFAEARKNLIIEASTDKDFSEDQTVSIFTQGDEALQDNELTISIYGEKIYHYFRIKKTVHNEHLQIAEFRAFGYKYIIPPADPNLALNKPSYASSAYEGHAVFFGNDGDENTTWASGGAEDKMNYPRWWVDLQDTCSVDSIIYVTRQDLSSYDGNRSGFVIEASNNPDFPEGSETEIFHTQADDDVIPDKATIKIEVNTDNAYRYIRVRKITQKHLNFGEIKIYGTVVKTTNTSTGIENGPGLIESKSKLYPNPVNKMLNVNIDSRNQNVTMYIFNLHGKVVLRKQYDLHNGTNDLQVDTQALYPGIYVLQIQGDNLNVVHKFHKVN